jgi:hypothetical protein
MSKEELTQENLEYIGHVYGKELHPMIHDLLDEIKKLRSENYPKYCYHCGKLVRKFQPLPPIPEEEEE